MNAISMQNFKKDYGAFAVEIPRLELQQGYVTGLVGKNGSGKTTLIRLALVPPPKLPEPSRYWAAISPPMPPSGNRWAL